MADQYVGDAVAVYFNSIDVSGTARTVTVEQSAGAPDTIDGTHKGDTARNLFEGMPGGVETNVTMELLDETGDVANIVDFALNALDTLYVYPEGRVHTYTQLTIAEARLTDLSQTIAYDDVASFSVSWNSKNTVTRGTYDSSA